MNSDIKKMYCEQLGIFEKVYDYSENIIPVPIPTDRGIEGLSRSEPRLVIPPEKYNSRIKGTL